ncbi:hypothetical protein SLEP1_g31269 [Rubroshorea leprosula]|uniref:Uncharacterized protein n=1 Tax=Rubroshorea leprosula TaxID=152421 RepID=A0AAV5K2W0_9ROSI|nr:hypothetical protein SLEP1_g31269 [Rubroshorea leprosula]
MAQPKWKHMHRHIRTPAVLLPLPTSSESKESTVRRGAAALAMAFLFNKFQEAVKALAKSPMFARDPRHLQFEADINRLFLYTSYNRLGKDADEADAEEIINMAGKASLADQQKQVQENIHDQIRDFCTSMDEILLPETMKIDESPESPARLNAAPRRSGLSFAVGNSSSPSGFPGEYLFAFYLICF